MISEVTTPLNLLRPAAPDAGRLASRTPWSAAAGSIAWLRAVIAVVGILALSAAVSVVSSAGSLTAQTPAAASGSAAPSQEPSGSGDSEHATRSTAEMGNAEFFTLKYEHLEPHALFGDGSVFTFYDVNLYQLIALAVMLVIFSLVLLSFRSTSVPWLLRVFRGWCHWLRDEVVCSAMSDEDGRKFAPFFIYLFFFIAFGNLIGLIPNQVTFTATVWVTGTLAVMIFVVMVVGGMMQQGVLSFWKNLLPHGLPMALVPLMFVLEIIGLLVKPFALTIRLFANMLAGHLVIYSFVAMIFLFAKLLGMSFALASGASVLPVGLAVFISIIEAFVALLQAYIFTFLSVIFVQQAMHPEH